MINRLHHSHQNEDPPIISAAKNGHLSLLKSLIQEGASLDVTDDKESYTALIWAVGCIHYDCVKSLVEAKAPLDIQGPDGETALTYASIGCVKECLSSVKLLINAKANVHLRTKNGDTALDIAIDRSFQECLEIACLLLNAGAAPTDPMKLYTYLSTQDKNDGLVFICYSLFCQQQENFRENKSTEPTLLLNDDLYTNALKTLSTLTHSSKKMMAPYKKDIFLKIDDAIKLNPTDLTNLIVDYDNPFNRLGLFKPLAISHSEDIDSNSNKIIKTV